MYDTCDMRQHLTEEGIIIGLLPALISLKSDVPHSRPPAFTLLLCIMGQTRLPPAWTLNIDIGHKLELRKIKYRCNTWVQWAADP